MINRNVKKTKFLLLNWLSYLNINHWKLEITLPKRYLYNFTNMHRGYYKYVHLKAFHKNMIYFEKKKETIFTFIKSINKRIKRKKII